jgi:hypothetical protein
MEYAARFHVERIVSTVAIIGGMALIIWKVPAIS